MIWDSNGEEEFIEVDIVDAVHTAATSFWRAAEDFTGIVGYKAYGPDDVDGVAGLAVWPSLVDLLEHSITMVNRPNTLYDPSEMAYLPDGAYIGRRCTLRTSCRPECCAGYGVLDDSGELLGPTPDGRSSCDPGTGTCRGGSRPAERDFGCGCGDFCSSGSRCAERSPPPC